MRQLEPGNSAPAAPSPAPPRRKAGNEVEPPAVFRVLASGARLRHPRPAPVGDLNPDNVVRHLDRDRDRLARSTRAAMPQTIGEKLAHQQRCHVPHGWPEPNSPSTNARASRARSARPASVTASRTASPAISAPAFAAASYPGNRAGRRADNGMHARLGGKRQGQTAPGTGTGTPSSGYPHRSLARFPSAIRPWTPQHNALQRYKVTHTGQKRNAPLAREFAASGAFSLVWQVFGSNQRRHPRGLGCQAACWVCWRWPHAVSSS